MFAVVLLVFGFAVYFSAVVRARCADRPGNPDSRIEYYLRRILYSGRRDSWQSSAARIAARS